MAKRSTHDEPEKRRLVSTHTEALSAVEKKDYLRQIEALKRAEKINRVLFRISNAVNTTSDLNQLYFSIHQTLSQIIDVSNFIIALYDSQKRTLRFPYYQDEKEKGPEELIVDYDVSDSLTGQVIIDRKPVLLNHEALLERESQRRLVGSVPLVWLGTPLIADDKVIGVMAVQSYTNPHLFDEKDIEILASVSEQVALAIDRKRAEKERVELISALQKTLAEVKTLKGIIPICSSCKKIRDDKGYWNQVEAYLRDHSDAEFSHSICQECVAKLYPDLDISKDESSSS
jgi:transcriptional regulator with GAF, ATPase, and Fis domain